MVKTKNFQLPITLLYLILFLTVINSFNLTYCATLKLTVVTNKTEYNVGETIQITGNLTMDGSPVSDWILALQVNDPRGKYHVLRALPIGSPQYFGVEVLNVYLSDEIGNPKSSVRRGTLGYITIIWRNKASQDLPASITLNLYYENKQPFLAFIPFKGTVRAGSTQNMTVSVPIPSDAPTGAAFVYSAAFSDMPSNDGYAYCPEKSSSFMITSTSTLSQLEKALQEDGTFNVTFKVPRQGALLGYYTIYASTLHQFQYFQKTRLFRVMLLGDVDFNGKVDMSDVGIILRAYGTKKGGQGWNPDYDLNKDDKVDMSDVGIVLRNYGNYGTY
ncbi:hypothetical protein KEJ32_02785 [Candidatus Bathyarchaeota archaeon]|nr:hypothetical protein [Candidatus Bathyarchaeota archaeon]